MHNPHRTCEDVVNSHDIPPGIGAIENRAFKASARSRGNFHDRKTSLRPRGGTAGDRHRVLDLEREDEEGLLYGLKPNATGL
jgi:hypothetical protein